MTKGKFECLPCKRLSLRSHLGTFNLSDASFYYVPRLQTLEGVPSPGPLLSPARCSLRTTFLTHQTQLESLVREVSTQDSALDDLSNLICVFGGLVRG